MTANPSYVGNGKLPFNRPSLRDERRVGQDTDTERAVLGVVLLAPARFSEVAARLKVSDFTLPEHRTVFSAMCALQEAGQPVDTALLGTQLKAMGQFQAIGGAAYVAELAQSVPTAANLDYYVEAVLNAADWRRVQAAAAAVREAVQIGDIEALDAALAQAGEHLRPLRDKRRGGLRTVCAADVAPQPLRWLWPGRIPAGNLTLISGDPGLGKSLLTLDIAARESTGRAWPDGAASGNPGKVLLANAEDNQADTLRPRLDAACADVTLVHFIDFVAEAGEEGPRIRNFDLRRDIGQLEEKLAELPDCRLVVIAPLNAHMGATDTHRDAEVRGALAPLASLAARTGVAILAVSHLTKQDNRAIYRSNGSIAFVAAARAASIVVRDPDDAKRRLWLPVKANLAEDSTGLAYFIEGGANGAPAVAWASEPIYLSADEVLSDNARGDRHDGAGEFLRGALKDGERPAGEVLQAGEDAGFSEKVIRRAFKRLNVQRRREGFGSEGGWFWRLQDVAEHRFP